MMNVATYYVIGYKYNYCWYFIIRFSPLFPFIILFVLSRDKTALLTMLFGNKTVSLYRGSIPDI